MDTMTPVVPVITSVAIQDHHILVFKGSLVVIGVEIRQHGIWVPQHLMDTEAPTLTLFDPLANAMVNEASMSHVSTGKWMYVHQTRRSHLPGLWTARVIAVNPAGITRLDNVGVFLLRDSAIAFFTYFTMRDAEGMLWFIWIDHAGQMNVTRNAPPDGVRVAEAMELPTADWIKIYNAAGDHRYVSVIVTGELYLDFAPPMATAGDTEQDGSPTFIATDGRSYVLSFDIAEQLVAQLV